MKSSTVTTVTRSVVDPRLGIFLSGSILEVT
jgi:hypothetical protein